MYVYMYIILGTSLSSCQCSHWWVKTLTFPICFSNNFVLILRILLWACWRSHQNAQMDFCWTSEQGAPWRLWAQGCLFLAPGSNIKRQQNITFSLCFLFLTLVLFCLLLVLGLGKSVSSSALFVMDNTFLTSSSNNRESVYGWNLLDGRPQGWIESWVMDDRKSSLFGFLHVWSLACYKSSHHLRKCLVHTKEQPFKL